MPSEDAQHELGRLIGANRGTRERGFYLLAAGFLVAGISFGETEKYVPSLCSPHPALSRRERGLRRKLFFGRPFFHLLAAGFLAAGGSFSLSASAGWKNRSS
jgi:hypothetical protein